MAKVVFLGLGSNLGDRCAYLDQVLGRLAWHTHIALCRVASYYETEPIGFTQQGKFLNTAAEITTDLSPWALLNYCRQIETSLKREPTIRWGPRTIDIDLLLYADNRSDHPGLHLPHSRLKQRAFVIYPLSEISASLTIEGIPLSVIKQRLSSKGVIRLAPHIGHYSRFGQRAGSPSSLQIRSLTNAIISNAGCTRTRYCQKKSYLGLKH